jgi:hypothetical protein
MGREIEPGQRVEVLIREILKKKYIGEHMWRENKWEQKKSYFLSSP